MLWINTVIAKLLPFFPESLVRIFALQYIAGETLSHALEKIRDFNNRGIGTTLDLLGEDPGKKSECTKAVDIYKKAIDDISHQGFKSGISLKPSHMGLKIDKQFCFDNIRSLALHARGHGLFVRIDMENDALKADTLALYLDLIKEFDNVGIVIQAYTRSGIKDINHLIEKRANIRLCKGAYFWEDRRIVYKEMDIINSSYIYLLEKLFKNQCFAGIATHDEALVFEAERLIDKLGVSKDKYEFQMLYGVNEDLRDIIVEQGHPIRIYVPFGEQWFAYSTRRLKENPKMIRYIVTNIFKKIFKQ